MEEKKWAVGEGIGGRERGKTERRREWGEREKEESHIDNIMHVTWKKTDIHT